MPAIVYLTFVCPLFSGVAMADWLSLPSTYTHDCRSGLRVNQYGQREPAYVPQPVRFRSSGYTHTRSSIQVDQSADHYHRVERWGDDVRPYGEWRFPYRPYSQPYATWGAPLAGLGQPFSHLHSGRFDRRGPGHRIGPRRPFRDSLNPYPVHPNSGYTSPPYYDGSYPSSPRSNRPSNRRFYAPLIPVPRIEPRTE